VVVGCTLPLVVWCIASPWTFAACLAAACCVRRLTRSTDARLRRRLVPTPLVEDREWRLLRLLPALSLAAVGWNMLLGAVGMALLLVAAVFGLPLLAADRPSRWPDGWEVGRIPDTVEELAPTGVVEVLEARASTPPARSRQSTAGPTTAPAQPWPGPRTLLPELDDDELLHAWEASTRALSLRPGPAALLRIVAARACYLDALAERDPDGLARRLEMGDREDGTASDPPA
jgi:hypothetical protein